MSNKDHVTQIVLMDARDYVIRYATYKTSDLSSICMFIEEGLKNPEVVKIAMKKYAPN